MTDQGILACARSCLSEVPNPAEYIAALEYLGQWNKAVMIGFNRNKQPGWGRFRLLRSVLPDLAGNVADCCLYFTLRQGFPLRPECNRVSLGHGSR